MSGHCLARVPFSTGKGRTSINDGDPFKRPFVQLYSRSAWIDSSLKLLQSSTFAYAVASTAGHLGLIRCSKLHHSLWVNLRRIWA